ncbi:CPBP family intramembrane glutamic endopeptidase [Pseudoflavitalea rhizosphaerae]|uniref:CPBP family intramembrane glutamic endopeptidase n=1 Tax=Pseudoflavitalea rhizosphaerae TaxID=1884793 RepID=UPI0013DF496F|nr:type II CAAX endopeptidase family protein [Pseudoflavitalea rhizosphaerae]
MMERLPAIPNGWVRVTVFLLSYIFCVILLGVLLATMVITGRVNLQLTPATMLQLVAITSLVSLFLVTVFRIYVDRRSIQSLGLAPFSKDGWVGLLLSIALLGCGSLLLYANGNLHWTDYSFDPYYFFTGLGLMVLVAFSEELVFRGYILGNLLEVSKNKWNALAISAVLFALVHMSNAGISFIAILNLLLAGLLLGLNCVYTKNLWFSIFFHFGWNFLQGPVLGYGVSGLGLPGVLQVELSGNPLLTGDKFGFEGSLMATFLLLTAILLLYLAFEKRKSAEA